MRKFKTFDVPSDLEAEGPLLMTSLQNLVGIDMKPYQEGGTDLRVKDLPLYPLPIVRDSMSVYELLDLFQLGMSR